MCLICCFSAKGSFRRGSLALAELCLRWSHFLLAAIVSAEKSLISPLLSGGGDVSAGHSSWCFHVRRCETRDVRLGIYPDLAFISFLENADIYVLPDLESFQKLFEELPSLSRPPIGMLSTRVLVPWRGWGVCLFPGLGFFFFHILL